MYLSETGFMYFSEIYLKLHFSILELYLEKLEIFLKYICAPRIRVFIVIW